MSSIVTPELLEQYAKSKGTSVLSFRIADDKKSAVFVLASGHKLNMQGKELIIEAEPAIEVPAEEPQPKKKGSKTK